MDDSNNVPACSDCKVCLSSIFCRSSREQVQEAETVREPSSYRKGQVIFSEHSYIFGVYCIHSGKVKLVHYGYDGREHIIRLARSGDMIGYDMLSGRKRHSSTAIALEDSVLCFIPQEKFKKMLRNDMGLSAEVLGKLALDLLKAEQHITNLAQKPVRERLADVLLMILETYGVEADGQTLNVYLTREEIAGMVGTAPESVIRMLADFKKEGLIELAPKKIVILKHNAVAKIADSDRYFGKAGSSTPGARTVIP